MADTAQLQFTVTNQEIERTDEFTVVESSEQYLYAQFTFSTDDWDGLYKTGVFIDETSLTAHPSLCNDDGICAVPTEWLVEQKGAVGVLGWDADGVKVTTRTARVRIYTKGYDGDVVDEDDAESYFDQLLEAFAESMDTATAAAKAAAASAVLAESYAHGGTDSRDGEDEDNAKYYAEMAEQAAATAGYMVLEIGEDGHLYLTRTDNLSDSLDMEINEDGRLEVTMS